MKNFISNKLVAATALLLLAAVGATSLSAQDPKCAYTFTGPGDGTIRQLDNPNVVLSFHIDEYSGNDTILYYLYFNLAESVYYDDVDHFTLWEDYDGDGQYGGSEGAIADWYPDYYGYNYQLSSMYFYPGSWISGGKYMDYIVTVDLTSNAAPGNSIRMETWDGNWEVYSYYYGWWNSPYESSYNGYASGPSMSIVPNNANLFLTAGAQVPAGNVIRGSVRAPILQFKLSSDGTGQNPTISAIRCRGDSAAPAHTAQSADVLAVRLYKEIGVPNGVVDASELSVPGYPQTGTFIGGTFTYQFPCSETITTAGTTFLVVADIAGTATLDRIFHMSIQQGDVDLSQGYATWTGTPKIIDDPQTIKNPLATYLSMTVQPTNTPAGDIINALSGGVCVVARKPDNSIDTSFTSPITVQIETGPGGFSAASTTSVQCVAGQASFSNLRITKTGDYTIRFISLPLSPVVSGSFTITPKPAIKLNIIAAPQNGKVGQPLPPPPVVQAWDLYNNLDYNYNGLITASLQSNPGLSTLLNNQIAATSGQATFPNLLMNRDAIGYTMVFSATGLTSSVPSPAFNIAIGDAYSIVILQQPGNATGGSAIPMQPHLQVLDWGGNEVVAYSGDMSAAIGNNPVGGTLSGVTSVPVVSSEAKFTSLIINKAGVGYTLVFSIEAGTISIETKPFDVDVGAPVRIAITQQPGDGTGGLPLSQASIVQIEDAGGNVVTNDSSSTTSVAITTGTGATGAVLSGTLALQMSGGTATFADLAIDLASGTPYSLTFTSDSGYASAVSATFVINVGAAYKLALTTQPGMATFGVPFVQQPVVQIQDAGGNLVTGATTMIMATLDPASGTAGATLQGTAAVAAVGGVVTFTNLAINFPGVGFMLTFDDAGSLVAVDSVLFSVASTATQLGVSVQPTVSSASQPLLTQPSVEVRDAMGTLVSVDFYTLVIAEIMPDTGTAGASLSGTTSLYVTNGTAAFTNLRISMPGVAYRLRFTCIPTLTSVISDAFDVAGTPVKLTLTRQPAGGDAGEFLSQQPRIEVRDANDVLCVTDNTTTVNAYITPATGTAHAILSGTNPVTTVNGVAAFTDLGIDRAGQGYTLSFSSAPSLFTEQSNPFEIVGEIAPSQSTENEVVAGVDGGSCSSGTTATPWLLLAVVALFGAVTLRRRTTR